MKTLNKLLIFIFVFNGLLTQCQSDSNWVFYKIIYLENISPIGIASEDSTLWISDPENNSIIQLGSTGTVLKKYSDFQRPMHIAVHNHIVYVPEYLSDQIKLILMDSIKYLQIHTCIDGPSAIDIRDNLIAIADFYNHKIVLVENGKTTLIGEKGNRHGELYYPTDVAIKNDLIYVGDAYNNRIQVFDKLGHFQQIIGEFDDIQVATGIYVSNDHIFVTDFYGNRVLIYDLKGNLIEVLSEQLNGPTDIIIQNNQLYICNYNSQSITIYERYNQ